MVAHQTLVVVHIKKLVVVEVELVLLVLIQVVILMEVQEVMVHRQEYQDQQQLMLEVQLVVQEVIMDFQ